MARSARPGGMASRGRAAVVLLALWVCLWASVTLGFLFLAVAQWTGLDPARDYEAAIGAVLIAFPTAAMTIFGIVRLRGKEPQPIPGAQPWTRVQPRPLPSVKSKSWLPMRRLNEAETALATLLSRLDAQEEFERPTLSTVHIWDSAADAAAALREIATTLETVEQAVVHAPPPQRAQLNSGVRELRERLDQGLDAYGDLIAAATQLLIASTSTSSMNDLIEATDHLVSRARALRELPKFP